MPQRARRPAAVPAAPPPLTVTQRHEQYVERLRSDGGRRVPIYLDGEAAEALETIKVVDGYASANAAIRGLLVARAKVIARRS